MTGIFSKIVKPERLVFTAVARDKEGNPLLEAPTTVTFAGHDGKTKLPCKRAPSASLLLRRECWKGWKRVGRKAWKNFHIS